MLQQPLYPPTCGREIIHEAVISRYNYPTLLVADEIGLFPYLNTTPATIEVVAQAFGMTPRAAEAMLGVLADRGHLVRYGGRFHITESSRQFLLPESPYYMGGVLEAGRRSPVTYEGVKQALLTSRPKTDPAVFFPDMWKASEEYAAELKAFTDVMHGLYFPVAMGMVVHGDFDGVNNLLDIGGGSGCFCIALALRYPEMGLTVFEVPAVCQIIPEYARPYGLAERIGTVAADMFRDDWPTGFDAHFLSNVFMTGTWGRAARWPRKFSMRCHRVGVFTSARHS